MFMVAGLCSCDVNDFLPILVGQMGYSKALCRGAIGKENSGKRREIEMVSGTKGSGAARHKVEYMRRLKRGRGRRMENREPSV